MRHWKLWSVVLLLGVLVVTSGCNTIRGAGKDIQRAGSKVEEVAR